MKKFFIAAFAVVTFLTAFTYFFSCLTPYISPASFWPMAFLALAFPYLAIVIVILAFSWIFIKRKIALFLLLLFFAGYKNLFATFAINPSSKPSLHKEPGTLRILTWNVRGFDNPAIGADSLNSVRMRMFNYISKVQPDILCLQEFTEHHIQGAFSNTATLKKLGYVNVFKTNEVIHHFYYGTMESGSAIFSKVPFLDTGKIMLGDPSYPEHLAYADISLQKKTIRVFATHFKSLNLYAGPEDVLNKVTFYGDTNFVYYSTKYEKLKAFAQAHAREALIVKEAMNRSRFPVVLGADMNSVPTSYPYHILSADVQDAFRKHGWGLGTTMDSLPKTLRIDFLLVDKKLAITKFKKDDVHLSDHFPQFIDVRWNDN